MKFLTSTDRVEVSVMKAVADRMSAMRAEAYEKAERDSG
jgi:hypothetical protein